MGLPLQFSLAIQLMVRDKVMNNELMKIRYNNHSIEFLKELSSEN
jgi:hypothetical protein